MQPLLLPCPETSSPCNSCSAAKIELRTFSPPETANGGARGLVNHSHQAELVRGSRFLSFLIAPLKTTLRGAFQFRRCPPPRLPKLPVNPQGGRSYWLYLYHPKQCFVYVNVLSIPFIPAAGTGSLPGRANATATPRLWKWGDGNVAALQECDRPLGRTILRIFGRPK